GEGVYRVGADGRGRRRLGPPSRVASFAYFHDASDRVVGASSADVLYRFSPDSQRIVFTDLGPSPTGNDAIQIATLEVATGRYRQVSHLSAPYDQRLNLLPTALAPRFADRDTIVFFAYAYAGSDSTDGWYRIHTDGTGLEPVTSPVAIPGSQVRP